RYQAAKQASESNCDADALSLRCSSISCLFRNGKAIEQAITTGGDQRTLAAAAGIVRGVPVGEVVVAESGLAAVGIARPVIACHVVTLRVRRAVELRAREDVVPVGRVAAARNETAALIQ